MANIKCSVKDCDYWGQMLCQAASIHVAVSSGDEASHSANTQCDTYRPRG